MKRLYVLLPLLLAGVLVWYWASRRGPLEVDAAAARRETLVSSLYTNGKLEPVRWQPVRVETGGRVKRVRLGEGDRVSAGELMAELEASSLEAELANAESRLAQARADWERITKGGDARLRAEIEGSLKTACLELETAQKEAAALERLVAKQAATNAELEAARRRIREAEARIAGLERQREALVQPQDGRAAEARLRDAEAAVRLAQSRIEATRIKAPMSGVVYSLAVRPGDMLEAGGLVAEVGDFSRFRVRVFVDEPELGRVAAGMPAVISWDGKPGVEWEGEVERLPSQVVALGARQVGEVVCRIENAEGLPVGANVNVEIRSKIVSNALTIPRECVRRRNGEAGVFVLEDGRLHWRTIQLGASSLSRVEVIEGLAEGAVVALPSDADLADGLPARARRRAP